MQGDTSAADALIREILPRLEEIALRELRRERYRTPVSKTELIHELWLHSLSRGGWRVRDRGHFFALASLGMRRVLVDLARKRLAARRGGGWEQTAPEGADSAALPGAADTEKIVAIGMLMERLDAKDSDAARVVDMHYFSGFTFDEIAQETGLTVRQVRVRFERGMAWLTRALRGRKPHDGASPSEACPG